MEPPNRFAYPKNHKALCSHRGPMGATRIALLHIYYIDGTRGAGPQKIGQSRGLAIVQPVW
jgi:hypothetical protein